MYINVQTHMFVPTLLLQSSVLSDPRVFVSMCVIYTSVDTHTHVNRCTYIHIHTYLLTYIHIYKHIMYMFICV